MSGWTIQSLIDRRMTVTAYCQLAACNHYKMLDLVALRDTLGPDTPAMADDLKPRLRCAKCGGKSIGVIYAPNTSAFGTKADVNAYQKAKEGR